MQTVGAAGTIYDVRYLQFFQADQIRGLGGTANPNDGRRVLAQVMHAPEVTNPPNPSGPAGSVRLANDGSMASLVPARRAMSWHLTSPTGVPVVRERYWLTMQPGEIRVCASCHGLNSRDQANAPVPTNPPEALRDFLRYWKETFYVAAAVMWAWMASEAFVRVPLLERRVGVLTREARRLDTLTLQLTEMQERYRQVQRMLGPTQATTVATPPTRPVTPPATPAAAPQKRPAADSSKDTTRDTTGTKTVPPTID